MAERDFRPPPPSRFGARRGPSLPHPEQNGFSPGMLPGAAAEHAEGLAEAEADAALRWIAPAVAGKDVIEVGCGDGAGAAILLDAGARSYLGTGSEEARIEQATRAHGERASFLVGEPQALPLAGGAYEVVICLDAIERATEADGILAALKRLLAPGGLLLVSLPTAPVQDPIGGGLIGQFRSPREWEQALAAMFANVRLQRRRSSLGAAVIAAEDEPTGIDAHWLGADPGEERAVLVLASDAELPDLPATASLVGARDLRAYRETILAWEHRARRAEADGAAKHWELVASREAQRRLRKRLWHLEHTPIRKLFRMLRGRPARLGEGPPIRPPEAEPERWD